MRVIVSHYLLIVTGSKKMKISKISVIAVAVIFMATSGTLLLNSSAQGTGANAQTAVPIGSTTQSHVINALSDPTLPSRFPPANFTNPQGSQPPAVPDTTPVVIPITAFGNVSIPNGTWETAILNVTGYDAGTAYDYFNSFNVNGATVWLGVNPEAGSWAVNVNISLFMSFFDGKNSISVSGTTLGLHQNFQGTSTIITHCCSIRSLQATLHQHIHQRSSRWERELITSIYPLIQWPPMCSPL